MSGMVWKLGEESMQLLSEGVSLYKRIRADVRKALPFFPLGFNTIKDDVLAYGLLLKDKAYLSVFTPGSDHAAIPLRFDGRQIRQVQVLYPSEGCCEFRLEDSILHIQMPQARAARLFLLTLA